MSNDLSFEYRRIRLWSANGIAVSTIYAYDVARYETAIQHPNFDAGYWIIVEYADSLEKALDMHSRWQNIFIEDKIKELTSVQMPMKYSRT